METNNDGIQFNNYYDSGCFVFLSMYGSYSSSLRDLFAISNLNISALWLLSMALTLKRNVQNAQNFRLNKIEWENFSKII